MHRGAVVLDSGWREVQEIATGRDGGGEILAGKRSRPRLLRMGSRLLPRAAAQPG